MQKIFNENPAIMKRYQNNKENKEDILEDY